MKIMDIRSLALPEVKVVRYGRFPDARGFFAEHYRKSDFAGPKLDFMKGVEFIQCNESYSKPGTVRGLHFQWNPYMGKLVRTIYGRMVDLVLDIRKGSPNFGKIIGHDMPASREAEYGEWIWVPPGFAHGNFYTQDSHIEYFCSGQYSPECEAAVSPVAGDLDWSLFPGELKKEFDGILSGNPLMTNKDRYGYSLAAWLENSDSDNFVFKQK